MFTIINNTLRLKPRNITHLSGYFKIAKLTAIFYPLGFSIGQASTFGQGYPFLIEAHIFKQGIGELAGKWMAMDFVDYIRTQHKFVTPQALIAQIEKDIQ